MKINLKEIVRPHLLNLKPYASARLEYSGEHGVFLDANENSLGSVLKGRYNRYPDPLQYDLKRQISFWRDVNIQRIFVGNGSDEIIDLLIRIFCEPGTDSIMVFPPTFAMYGTLAQFHHIAVKEVQLNRDFQLDVEQILQQLDEHVKILFICSPNNPTGNLINHEDIKLLLNSFKGIVVIDEAYIDFSNQASWIGELDAQQNLIVLQTFSKAWGLAALRLGMAFADEGIIALMNTIKLPYNVNSLSQQLGLEALDRRAEMEKMVEKIHQYRKELVAELEKLPEIEKVYRSDANFVLVKMRNAGEVYNQLLIRKVIVRNRSNVVLCEDCLRITVGSREDHQVLIKSLKEIFHEQEQKEDTVP